MDSGLGESLRGDLANEWWPARAQTDLGASAPMIKGGVTAGPAPTADDTGGAVFQPRMVCKGTPQGPS